MVRYLHVMLLIYPPFVGVLLGAWLAREAGAVTGLALGLLASAAIAACLLGRG